jgi:hypothetical protein
MKAQSELKNYLQHQKNTNLTLFQRCLTIVYTYLKTQASTPQE